MHSTRWILFASLALLLSFTVHAQKHEADHKNASLGITFSSFGDNALIHFEPLIGAASYSGKSFYSLGVDYLVPISQSFDFEMGIEYSHHKMMVDPNLPPSMDKPEYPVYLDMVELPFGIRFNFLNYFFVGAGGLLNLDVSHPGISATQTGMGACASLGVKYDFKSGLSAFINPYVKASALLPFSSEDPHRHLMVAGWRFGVLYRLGRKND